MEQKYLTLKQAADYLNLPMTQIYRLSSEGRLPGKVCWGRRTIRIDRAQLEEWIANQSKGDNQNG